MKQSAKLFLQPVGPLAISVNTSLGDVRNLQLRPAPLSTTAERLSFRDHENIGLGLAMCHTTAIVAQLESGSNSSFQGRQGSLKGAVLLRRRGTHRTSP